MLIEGRNAVREALSNDVTINKLMVDKALEHRHDEIVTLAYKKHVKVEFVMKNVLDKKSLTSRHKSFIAEAVDFKYCEVTDILAKSKQQSSVPFIVLLDGIEDPHNFGAIIRSCECAGVDGIIIPKNRACQVNETVIRTSTGAITNMLIAKVTNLKDAIDTLKGAGVWVFACETGGEDIYSKNLNLPIALIIGSEGKGIKQSLRAYADGILTLPLMGKVNSLNASVACGVAVFEVLRQKIKGV